MAEEKKEKSFRENMLNEMSSLLKEIDSNKDYRLRTPINDMIGALEKSKSDTEAKRIIEYYKYNTKLFEHLYDNEYDLEKITPKFNDAMLKTLPLVESDKFSKEFLTDSFKTKDLFTRGSESNWQNLNKKQIEEKAKELETTPEELTDALKKHQERYEREYDPNMLKRLGLDIGSIIMPRTTEEYYETGDVSGKNVGLDLAENVAYMGAGKGVKALGSIGGKVLSKTPKTAKLLSSPVTKTGKLIGEAAAAPAIVEGLETISDDANTPVGDIFSKTVSNIITPRIFKAGTSRFLKDVPTLQKPAEKVLTSDYFVNKFGDISGDVGRRSETISNTLKNVPVIGTYLTEKEIQEKLAKEKKTKQEKIDYLKKLGLYDLISNVNLEDEE